MFFLSGQYSEREQRRLFVRRLFRRMFLEDWLLKLVALGITLALWLGVTGMRAPTTVRFKNVALNLRVAGDMEITNSPVQEIELVVTGDKRLVDRVNSRDLIVAVDLSEIRAGDQIVQMTPENINIDLPNGLKIDEIQPNKIAVRLEKVEEREVTVKTETEGSVAENLEVYAETVTPAKVRVRGPQSVVRSLDAISTEKINLDSASESFVARQIALNVVNPKITLLDTSVDVAFRVGEKRTERMMIVSAQGDGQTKQITLVLYGARSILEKLTPDQIAASLVKNENGEYAPQVILPPEIQNAVEIKNVKIK